LTVLQLDPTQPRFAITDDKQGLSPWQEPNIVYSREFDQTLRGEAIPIVVPVPTEAQLDPTSDESPQLLRGEGNERRYGRPERQFFLMQLFELIYPNLAILYDTVEVFASLTFRGGDCE